MSEAKDLVKRLLKGLPRWFTFGRSDVVEQATKAIDRCKRMDAAINEGSADGSTIAAFNLGVEVGRLLATAEYPMSLAEANEAAALEESRKAKLRGGANGVNLKKDIQKQAILYWSLFDTKQEMRTGAMVEVIRAWLERERPEANLTDKTIREYISEVAKRSGRTYAQRRGGGKNDSADKENLLNIINGKE